MALTEVAAAACWSLAARVDMVLSPCGWTIPPIYDGNRRFVTSIQRIRGDTHRVSRSRNSEPGRPGSPPARWRRIRTCGLRCRHQDGVDHVDHAVGLVDVRDRHRRRAALGVDDHHGIGRLLDRELLALDGPE